MGSIPAALDIAKTKKSNFFKKSKTNAKLSFLVPNPKALTRHKEAINHKYLSKFKDAKVKSYLVPFTYNKAYTNITSMRKYAKAASFYTLGLNRYTASS